jgi:hypothetical protein
MICALARFGQMTIECNPTDATPFKASQSVLSNHVFCVCYARSALARWYPRSDYGQMEFNPRPFSGAPAAYWRWFVRLKLSISAARPASTKNAERGRGQLREAAWTSPSRKIPDIEIGCCVQKRHTTALEPLSRWNPYFKTAVCAQRPVLFSSLRLILSDVFPPPHVDLCLCFLGAT